ncbi:MAG: ABC transporter permease [Desulfobacterales bacterium]|nr:ABC transporter permease [Desulfobacterales bacterium]
MRRVVKYLRKDAKARETPRLTWRLVHKAGFGAAGMGVFILLWALAGRFFFTRPGFEQFSGFLPAPALKALCSLALEMDFWYSIQASLRRVVVGIAIAFSLGYPFGLLIGFYFKLRVLTYPPMQFVRMISPLSWMPIALLVFASFESAIYFLITMATVWPIILNTTLGVLRVNPRWIKMAMSQGAKNRQLILHIVIPASVPYILTSLRMALGVAWIVLVPAEFLGISSGLGYLINDARDTMEYDRLMAIVVAIGVLGFLLDGAIQLIRKSFNWIYI